MNQIRAIQALNKRELEHGMYAPRLPASPPPPSPNRTPELCQADADNAAAPPEASWHADYRDTAYVYFGGLPYALSEGDVIVVFSQYGEPVFVKLARDKETGKSKGFGWLKYRDQRSADLAVDNLGGADVLGRVMRVDHARFKAHEDDDLEEGLVDWESMMRREGKRVDESDSEDESGGEGGGRKKVAGMLEEEKELARLVREHDEDDPMKAYLVDEKKREIAEAKERRERKEKKERHSHSHRHHRSRRTRRHESDDEDDRERRRRRDSPRERERGSRRKSPAESGDEDRDPYEAERERRRRDKERRRGDDESPDRERRRRRERDDSRERRRDRDGDRARRERRRSRSP